MMMTFKATMEIVAEMEPEMSKRMRTQRTGNPQTKTQKTETQETGTRQTGTAA